MDYRSLLREMFDAAVAAASPALCIPKYLPEAPKGRTVVVGAGKAAAAMAAAVEANWSGPIEGLVVTRYGHAVPCRHIEVIEAAHPVPDAAGREAARRILEKVRDLGPGDLVLCLLSGGGSALLALPAAGVTLEDKQAINRALLHSGADIGEMNTVRKHLSAIKGGRLAGAAWPAEIVSLLISDVPGDDPSVIGSGPTVGDPSTFADARAVLARYALDVPDGVVRALADPAGETPKPGDPIFARTSFALASRPADVFQCAQAAARAAGYECVLLGANLEGEARDIAARHAELARSLRSQGRRAVILSGGELTVTVRGKGRGGPNQEYVLAMVEAL